MAPRLSKLAGTPMIFKPKKVKVLDFHLRAWLNKNGMIGSLFLENFLLWEDLGKEYVEFGLAIFNGETRVIDPEQARVIQMGAECMSTNNIFSPTKKPKEKKQRN
jgi:hypothetical protein